MDNTENILIVGAGASGLATALALAKSGTIPTLIDQKDAPSCLSRAVGILPSTIALFKEHGLLEAIKKEAQIAQAMHIFEKDQCTVKLRLDRNRQKNLWLLPQDRTESLLREKLEALGGQVLWGHKLENLEQKTNGVMTTISNQKHFFDHVVGADGTRSLTRNLANIPYLGFDLDETWSIADVVLKKRIPPVLSLFFNTENRIVGWFPLGTKRVRLVANHPDAIGSLPIKLEIDNIRVERTFNIGIYQAKHYQNGRIYLVGDAAHCHSPVGGRGMNLGIADGFNLAHRLIHGNLETYSHDRHRIGEKTIKETERARKLFMHANPYQRKALLALLRFASHHPRIEQWWVNKFALSS